MTPNPARVVAITGAAGVVGRHLCDAFRGRGWRVRALVRDPARYAAEPGVGAFACDLPDRIDPPGVRGADVLIHAAYTTRATDPDLARRVNEDGSRRLFDLARAVGVRQIVFLSSFSSRPDARSYYGRSKYAVEQLLDPARDLAVRAGLVLAADGGLFARIAGTLARSRAVPLVGGRAHIQTVHVDDLCAACVAAADRGVTGLVHVAEPNGLPFGDLLRLVLRAQGRRCPLVPVPARLVLAGLRCTEAVGLRLGVTAENLLGMLGLRFVPTAADLARLGVTARPAADSVAALLGGGGRPAARAA